MDESLASIFDDWEKSKQASRRWRREARESFAFYAGHQWEEEDKDYLESTLGKPAVTFNRVAPLIDSVTGFQVTNRQEVKFEPRGLEDGGVSETLNKAVDWIREQAYADDEESHAFEDAVICGMGWTETRMDYDDDLDGQIKVDHVPPLEMYWDANARRKNLEDMRWVARVKKLTKRDLTEQFGEEITEDLSPTNLEEPGYIEPHDSSEDWRYKGDVVYESETGKYLVLQVQSWDYETVYRVGNPLSGRVEELTEEQYANLAPRLEGMGIQSLRQRRKRWTQYFAAGNKEWDHTSIPSPTLKCITGKWDERSKQFFGVMRAMVDPQRWANKFYSSAIEILNKNPKGGLLAEEGAFANPRKAEEDWAASDSIIHLNAGGLGKIKEKTSSGYPSSFDKLMLHATSAIGDVSGINPEFIGQANREQAGVLEYERKKSALVILAGMFDGMKRYRKGQGRVMLHFISKFIPDQTLLKVAGRESQAHIPAIRSENIYKYDVIVDTAPNSPSQKQEVWAVFQNLIPSLLTAGVPIPPSIIKYLPLPESMANEWIEYIESQGQQQPSMAEQAMVENMSAQTEERRAKAAYNEASALEKLSKSQEQPVQGSPFVERDVMAQLVR